MIERYYLDCDDNVAVICDGHTGDCVKSFRYFSGLGELAGDAIALAQIALEALNAKTATAVTEAPQAG